MKKALSIILCFAILVAILVAVIPASGYSYTPNIMTLSGMDYQYYYVGDAVATAPDITDGVITPGEYSYSEDWENVSTTPHTSDAHPFLAGFDATGNDLRGDDAVAQAGTDTMSVNFAYDADWVYIAFEAASPTPNFRPFAFSIHNPNPTNYGEMMNRLFYWVKTADDCTGNTISEGTHAITFGGNNNHITWGPRNYIMDDFGTQLGINGYCPTSPTEDIFAYLTYDTTSETQVLELKIKKSGLATAFYKDVDDIDSFGFSVFHVYTNDVAEPVYHDDYKIAYYMQLLSNSQSNLLESTGDLDITPAWVPYYIHLGTEADFTPPATTTFVTTTYPRPFTTATYPYPPRTTYSQPFTTATYPFTTVDHPCTTTIDPEHTTSVTRDNYYDEEEDDDDEVITRKTTAAATTESDGNGCGGAIGLSALALVPCALLGMAIVKKKED